MSKYNFAFKKKVVSAYLNGEGGEQYIATKFGIKHKLTVNGWVRCYTEEDDEDYGHEKTKITLLNISVL